MTRKTFDTHLQELHDELVYIGAMVEEQLDNAIESLVKKNIELADKTIANDKKIDSLQRKIDNECIHLISLEHPLAIDLRNLFTITKVVTDLERMGDYSVNIAKTTQRLKNEDYFKSTTYITQMSDIVKVMVKDSVDAYVDRDEKKSHQIVKMDDEIDQLYKSIFTELILMMAKEPSLVHQASQFLFVCKHLERIADHATNICEWTIYLVTGEKLELND